MAKILYGAPVKEKIKEKLKESIKKLEKKPCLGIVQVGDREDSSAYIRQKQKFGEEVGVKILLHKYPENILERDLEERIKELVKNKDIDGIIVQLPLPKAINSEKIINLIPKNKDADGLSTISEFQTNNIITPATARAVLALLDFYEIQIKNKKIVVIGRSRLAGGPIAQELEKRGALVEVCHKATKNTKEICKEAEILVVAAGQIGLITKDFVNKNQVVVDVGINRPHPSLLVGPPLDKEREGQTKPSLPKLVGDVNFAEVEPLVSAITPVPGGIGPLTVACLFENLLDLCYTT